MDDAAGEGRRRLVSLFCDEGPSSSVGVPGSRRSFADASLRDDGRVLPLLLRAEDLEGQLLPTTARHLAYSRRDLQPSMRRVVVTWMLEVCTGIIHHHHRRRRHGHKLNSVAIDRRPLYCIQLT